MDHLIGQRFSLISKSEIRYAKTPISRLMDAKIDKNRYVGILHEINPEQSTIALEEVFSFGTEDRRVENYIPPSLQKFEYIVFRGSDVKDIKIVEEQQEQKPPSQPPNDPAILVRDLLTFTSMNLCYMMKYFGCKSQTCTECANCVDISVAFLLTKELSDFKNTTMLA